MTAHDDFAAFIADAEAGQQYAKWARDNPGELARWQAFRDAVLAGGSPPAPSMTTPHGRELIDAAVRCRHRRCGRTEHYHAAEQPAPTPEPTPSTRVFTLDFEDGVLPASMSQERATPGNIVLVQTDPLTGRYSVLVTCGIESVGVAGSGGNRRAELHLPSFVSVLGVATLQGVELWTAHTLRVLAMPLGSWATVTQYWTGGPSLFDYSFTSDGRFVAETRGGAATAGQRGAVLRAAPPTLNERLDFVTHTKWSTGEDGITEVWLNGVGSTLPGPNLIVGEEARPYMKCGVYRGTPTVADAVTVVQVDNIRWATTLEGLA